MSRLEEMVRALSPESQQEVEDFIQHLLKKQTHKPAQGLTLNWRGALREEQHITSVEIQHQLRDSWSD